MSFTVFGDDSTIKSRSNMMFSGLGRSLKQLRRECLCTRHCHSGIQEPKARENCSACDLLRSWLDIAVDDVVLVQVS